MRRLSVGVALVGNSNVVFFDEPTTGLDPESRRQLWSIIQRARSDRALILTTHSMDEAEVLSDRIGILAMGKLCCLGTPNHLKNSMGNLYHLKINFEEEMMTAAENFVFSIFPSAKLVRNFKNNSEFYISADGILVSDIFAKLASDSASSGISNWSFSQVGLSEVFQAVVDNSHL